MTNISCVYATARPSKNAMIGRDDDHIKLYLDSLAKQTFKDFEVIIADCLYDRRSLDDPIEDHAGLIDGPGIARGHGYKSAYYLFDITHFQVKSPWLKRGLWTGQAPWNQAAMLADGELLVFFGDCCEAPPDYLERIWDWYEKGLWCMGLVIYKRGGTLALKDDLKEGGALDKLKGVLPEETGILAFKKLMDMNWDVRSAVIRDSRWPYVEGNPSGLCHLVGISGGQQFHGYSCLPLQVLLKLNGFDENFDGDKALGDCDLGIRAAMAGFDNALLLDKDVWIFENAHYSVPEDFLTYRGPSIRSNYSLMMLNQEKRRWRANSYRLTDEEVNWILEHGKAWGFPDVEKVRINDHFQWWVQNPPIFDLAELRWKAQQTGEIPEYYK